MNSQDGRALVTGASAGIGRELACEFAAGGYDLLVVARREERLDALADELEADHDVTVDVIATDLSSPGSARDLYEEIQSQDLRVDVLVNNVGIGTYGHFHETDVERELDQVRLNVELPMHLTRLLLPGMIEHDRGTILNVASIAGFQPGPKMAGYYASKSYVVSFSQAISEELTETNVSVTALCPGTVDTEFQDRAEMSDSRVGSNYSLTAREVAEAGFEGAKGERPVVIPGAGNKLLYLLSKFSPRVLRRKAAAWVNADR